MTLLCGIGARQPYPPLSILFGLLGLSLPHLFGTLHYARLTGLDVWASALVMSFPYLFKDVASVGAACLVGKNVRRRLPAELLTGRRP